MTKEFIIGFIIVSAIYYVIMYKLKFITFHTVERLEEKKEVVSLYKEEEKQNTEPTEQKKELPLINIPEIDKIIVIKKDGKKGMVLRNDVELKYNGSTITSLDLISNDNSTKNETTDKTNTEKSNKPQEKIEEENNKNDKKPFTFDKTKLVSKSKK